MSWTRCSFQPGAVRVASVRGQGRRPSCSATFDSFYLFYFFIVMSGACRAQHNHAHGHSHGHGGHEDHDHEDGPDRGNEMSLFQHIDMPNVRAFNESVPGSARLVIKPYEHRNDVTQFVESDADEQLIVFVPFTGLVKLKSICLRGGPGIKAPRTMKVFVNREDIDFDSVEDLKAVQEWDLSPEDNIILEYQTRMTKFQGITSVTLFFPDNFGGESTSIYYLGFRGEWEEVKREPVVAVYELKPNPADHPLPKDMEVKYYNH